MSQIFQLGENSAVKGYSDDLCELLFVGQMYSVFCLMLGHISHGVSFWRGKWLKKLMKDCMAIGIFQKM